ncbi:response regulator [Nitratidesulfovibrio sp. HK-II]|uniref:response regulator n=1 Tax=Nitratidesulfovibrio sp. HK-II TaxID=2009266 RepID=UPI000E2EBC50|nr:response regulator [Nitratidesulfovibrio sp. HK-II]GBO97113.1 response regulator [Nitratidesulfovibrio sp. HK-II]
MDCPELLKRCRILLVDDEDGFRDALLRRMRKRGVTMDGVGSGRAALDWLARQAVDVVILDIQLGDMDGRDVLREIRKSGGEDPAVIILSGHAYTDIALDAMRAGASDYLLKPCPVEELLERIETAFEQVLERRAAQ